MDVRIDRFATEYRLQAEQLLPASLEELFSFFSDARNLELLTPEFLNFKVINRGPITMAADTIIDYKLRLYGARFRWKTLIADWNPPLMFCDQQISGPYRYWIHQHHFTETESGVLVRDLVRYRHVGGEIVHRLFVKPNLLKIFSYRQVRMCEIFSGSMEKSAAPSELPVLS